MGKKNDLMLRIIELKTSNYKFGSTEYDLITAFIDIILNDEEIKEIEF